MKNFLRGGFRVFLPSNRYSIVGIENKGFFCTSHKDKNHPKTTRAKIKSEESQYSALADKGSLLSENSHVEKELADFAEVSVEEKEKRQNRFRKWSLLKEAPLRGLLIRWASLGVAPLRGVLLRRRLIEILSIHCFLPVILIVFCSSFSVIQACPGRFVNPVTDICWSCLFPITIGPVKVNAGGREDTPNPNQALCLCPRPPLPIPVPGIPVGFWEPARLVDITRTPFCMVNMGGIQLGRSLHQHGVHGSRGGARTKNSFYQVHWYVYPVIYWLELLVDFLCLEQQSFDVAYITELDPLWNEDELSFILNPEAILFGNPIAQAACAADCGATSAGFPMDSLFWCGGCQGSLYPFTGNNAAHIGGVGSSLLLTQRMMAKLHREFLLWGTSGSAALCQKYPLPVIKKTQYKTQMTYPRPTTRGPMACNPLGRSEVIWGSGREFPYKGEDFGYLIWRKRNCCIL